MKYHLIRDLDDNHIAIIGIEFTVETYGHGRQELAMFSPEGLILPRLYPQGDRYSPSITFHSTIGDYTISGNYAPW